jgi:hypothetical protein
VTIGVPARAWACLAAAWLGSAWGQPPAPITVSRQEVLELGSPLAGEYSLGLHAVIFSGSGWGASAVGAIFREAAVILAQCGVRLGRVTLLHVEAHPRYHFYFTPVSRELARTADFPRPTVYFVRDSLNRPAFDAEAVGRSNSRSRPELTNTVWMALGARDPGIAMAHELVHLLADSGEHSGLPDNLMRAETTPGNIRLEATQCARLVSRGTEDGLLQGSR